MWRCKGLQNYCCTELLLIAVFPLPDWSASWLGRLAIELHLLPRKGAISHCRWSRGNRRVRQYSRKLHGKPKNNALSWESLLTSYCNIFSSFLTATTFLHKGSYPLQSLASNSRWSSTTLACLWGIPFCATAKMAPQCGGKYSICSNDGGRGPPNQWISLCRTRSPLVTRVLWSAVRVLPVIRQLKVLSLVARCHHNAVPSLCTSLYGE